MNNNQFPATQSSNNQTHKEGRADGIFAAKIKKYFKKGKKTAFRMGENNSKWRNWPRINLKNIQAAHAAQYQKNKQPNQKMGQRTK